MSEITFDYNPLPNIDTVTDNGNPFIISPSAPYGISYFQTRETLSDPESYRAFLKNIEYRFRTSRMYKNYKARLYDLGLDRCQVLGMITSDMAKIEMHHAFFTLFDLSMIITEHQLNTVGYVTTFDVIRILKQEHKEYNIPLVMLSKTVHELYHKDNSFFIHPNMFFGNWPNFIERYKDGLTQDIAFKALYYLKKTINTTDTNDNGLLELREKIKSWSGITDVE